ncbi:aminoacyl-histidine dipeptidase [Thiotrichales bacterium 19S3-7]|nr:aminoacyl-histidine dipeptidase [Thiotrichales bacterium 19S3-7]MCF6801541.1 aminoacyl-histidine dipeptidase [Thiotrichales bacterium 19S3-11]
MFTDLDYPNVWTLFDQIRQIPRPSFKEKAIREFIYQWANKNQFKITEDQAHNLVIYVPATCGYEDREVVAAQGHLDMVCEKHSDIDFNFDSDAINVYRDGDWIRANGTTLGADNGIGVALMMAAATDPNVIHGPMEILLTATEEKGLVGARNLDPNILSARYMLNIDSESWGEFCIGCAGGGDSLINLSVESVKSNLNDQAYQLKISGLKGGHSGVDIHKQHGNALKILGRILRSIPHAKLASFEGGNLRNAIPREAVANILFEPNQKDKEIQCIKQTFTIIEKELSTIEPKLSLDITPLKELPQEYVRLSSQNTLLNLIEALPHGVVSMDHHIADLVETSSNLASVKFNSDSRQFLITLSTRSSVMSKLQAQRQHISSIAQLANAQVNHDEAYPGWQPNPHSDIVKKALAVYQETFNAQAQVAAIHAGLECGIINGKYPNMQMISFGPDIRGAHSPEERLNIPTTLQCYDLLKNLLKAFANEKKPLTQNQLEAVTA